MIWIIIAGFFVIAVLVVIGFWILGNRLREVDRRVYEAIMRIPVTDFPPIPDCKFQLYEFRCNAQDQPCLYSPGSEPERICALREEERKAGSHKTEVIPAPRWNESTG